MGVCVCVRAWVCVYFLQFPGLAKNKKKRKSEPILAI
jgi:hypothetical protein